MILRILTAFFAVMYTLGVSAQNDGTLITGFSEHAVTRDASAVFEANSDDQGMLAPRLSLAQRNAIVNPATSLLIYQTDNTPGYYYNAGSAGSPAWERLQVASGAVTGSGAATRVAFWSATSALSSSANLFWDNPNSRLGINTAVPLAGLQVRNARAYINKSNVDPAAIYANADLVLGDNTTNRSGHTGGTGSHIFLQSIDKSTITALDESNNLGQISYQNLVWTIGEDVGWNAQGVRLPVLGSGYVKSNATGNLSSGAILAADVPTLNQNTTGNAATATNVSYAGVTNIPTRTDWATANPHRGFVAEQMSWKNYGNSHTIFDASAGTSPSGTAVNNTNAQVAWSATYPTLMGWNGANTYGVRVDVARYAESAGSAPGDNLGNHTATTALNMAGNAINNAIQINSNGDHIEFMGNRTDDNSYEWMGYYSGVTRQGIILYDGAWTGANNVTNEFSITSENNNLLTLNTSGNAHIALMPKGTGNVGIGTLAPGSKMEVVNDALTLTGANLDINRDASVRGGISWYSKNYPGWSDYMSPAGQTGAGPHGDLTAPSGTYVNSWAARSYIENVAGYGWTFESAPHPSTTPAVKFEIRSSDGLFHSYGDGLIDGYVNSGAGYRVGGAAPSGQYLRGNGTNFVAAAIAAGDLPAHTHLWSQVTSKPAAWLDGPTLIQSNANFNNSMPSGFYEHSGATNAPSATWYNMINVRHSNTSNDHGFQIAASYYDEYMYSRTYQGGTGANNGSFTPWARHITNRPGDWDVASNSNATGYGNATLELRETNFAGAGQQPPRLGFHWSGVVASQISIETDGKISIRNNPGTDYENIIANRYFSTNTSNSYERSSVANGIWAGEALNNASVHIYNSESEQGGFFANGDYNGIYSPGDNDLVKFMDEDYFNGAGTIYDNNAVRARIDGNGQYFMISDRNFKEHISPVTNAVAKLNQIKGYTYTYKRNAVEIEKNSPIIVGAGVIAQELKEVLPEAVSDQDGHLMVNYSAISALFIEAIKEQQVQIAALQHQNAAMQARLDALETQKR